MGEIAWVFTYSKISIIRGRKGTTKLFELMQCSKYPKWT